MKRLRSQQLKLPELKVPLVLSNLYWDLRDRRLLPLVALLLVAIVAAPFLLGSGGKSPEPTARVPASGAGAQRSASLVVLPAEPGLREPSKRLAGRLSKDPFKQHYTAPLLKPGAAPVSETKTATTTTSTSTSATTTTDGGGSTTSSSTEGSSESVPPPVPSQPAGNPGPPQPHGGTAHGGSGGSGGSGGNGNGDAVPPSGLTYYAFAVDVQITQIRTKPDGSIETSGPTVRQEVEPPAALPGEKAPVVTYMGASSKTHNPLFLISTEVTEVFGEGKCVAGTSTCQLIELEPTFPVTFVYGQNDVRYKLNVLKVVPVITGHS